MCQDIGSLLGRRLNCQCKVTSKAKGHKHFCDDEHRSDQHVHRVVQERRLTMFEASVTENLQRPADDKQSGCGKPNRSGGNMADDERGSPHKQSDNCSDGESNCEVKEKPRNRGRYDQYCCGIGWHAEQVQLTKAQWQNNGEKNNRNSKHVREAIALVTMVARINSQLMSEIFIHLTPRTKAYDMNVTASLRSVFGTANSAASTTIG